MQRVWRDEVAHRPKRVDRRAQRGRERNRRPDEQASVGEPDHRHARGVGEAIERHHWPVGDPDNGAERLQVLSIEAHGKLTSQFQNADSDHLGAPGEPRLASGRLAALRDHGVVFSHRHRLEIYFIKMLDEHALRRSLGVFLILYSVYALATAKASRTFCALARGVSSGHGSAIVRGRRPP